jgi:hypothetical protein
MVRRASDGTRVLLRAGDNGLFYLFVDVYYDIISTS